MTSGEYECIVAVPGLSRYDAQTGIGKQVSLIAKASPHQITFVDAEFRTIDLPILRNIPVGIRMPPGTNAVLVPQLTGAQALRRITRVPSAVLVHDIGVVDCRLDRSETDFVTRQIILQSLRGLRYATSITCVSHFTRTRLLELLPELHADCIVVIHNGVDEAFLSYRGTVEGARDRTENLVRAPLGSPLLVYAGTERPRKNVRLLLELLRMLRTSHPHAQLLKLGSAGGHGWRQTTLDAMSRLDLVADRDVVFLEGLSDAQMADAYRAGDVFVSASLYEGFGLPPMEAMAVGTPVVVSDRAAFPEVVADAGWLVEPTVEDFLGGVKTALQEGHSPSRIDYGRQRAQKFSSSRAAHLYGEALTNMLARWKRDRA